MGIVVRPAVGVFRRTLPMIIVFGAYRRYEIDAPLSDTELDTITGVVDLARRFHSPLAFSRAVSNETASQAGVWLPGCRPKVTDRVFDHEPGSAFANAEFSGVLNTITQRGFCVTGPENDSSLSATLADLKAQNREVEVITRPGLLQKCSTPLEDWSDTAQNATNCNHLSTVSVQARRRSLRLVNVMG